ncbi:hypothetical protein BEK98_46410 [Streptomyces diastatochromogenes]|uniref:Uncharacterized protein n=1 Tax=Streptomyces diastatochromogenes TaxID=42236 RepID=A0A233RM21_STRDA|nr:hypothetical protein BEK98_46410 [Streptomyces diastatochromogenes]
MFSSVTAVSSTSPRTCRQAGHRWWRRPAGSSFPDSSTATGTPGRACEIRKLAGQLVGIDTADLARWCAESLHDIRRRYAALPAEVVGSAWRGMF